MSSYSSNIISSNSVTLKQSKKNIINMISRFMSFRILYKNMPEKLFFSVAVIVVAVWISPQ